MNLEKQWWDKSEGKEVLYSESSEVEIDKKVVSKENENQWTKIL